MKLNQVIALVSSKKARATRSLTDAYQHWKENLLKGIIRNYTPVDEDGERFPSESREVQLRLHREIPKLNKFLTDFYDCVLTQETGNQLAKATIKIDELILSDIPVTVILFLEKQTVDLLTFAKNLEVLESDRKWEYDNVNDCYVSEPEKTTKTKKIPEVIVKYKATTEHPAQTEIFPIDKTIGHWETIHLSGAVTKSFRENLINKLEKLQDALKKAREEANCQEVEFKKIGNELFEYLFSDLTS